MLLDGAHLFADALAAGLSIETVAFTARAASLPEVARLVDASRPHRPSWSRSPIR